MKPQKYQAWIEIPNREWPALWKHHFHVWLVDADVMIAGAWIFLVIGRIIVKIALMLLG